MNIQFTTSPTFSYSTSRNFVSFQNITPSYVFVQVEEYTGTNVYVSTDETGEELWEEGTTIVRSEIIPAEEALQLMLLHFNTERPITIGGKFLFVTTVNYRSYKTGMVINGEEVFVSQKVKGGLCWPFIGLQFVAHLATQAVIPLSSSEAPF